MVCFYGQSYARGRLDVAIPDPLTRLKERCDDLKDLITDLRVDIAYLPVSYTHLDVYKRQA